MDFPELEFPGGHFQFRARGKMDLRSVNASMGNLPGTFMAFATQFDTETPEIPKSDNGSFTQVFRDYLYE
jgi:hypothetical protein